jgi:hypothetical protein
MFSEIFSFLCLYYNAHDNIMKVIMNFMIYLLKNCISLMWIYLSNMETTLIFKSSLYNHRLTISLAPEPEGSLPHSQEPTTGPYP